MLQKAVRYCLMLSVITLAFVSIVVATPSLVQAQTADQLGIGTIKAPPGTEEIIVQAQAQGQNIALIFFMSNMIKLFSVIMGIWVIFNGILAGYLLLNSSGDSGGFEKARTQITQSAIGLIMIVMAYTFTGLVGLIFFGDAGIFLNPKI